MREWILMVCVACLLPVVSAAEEPQISADIGPCSVDFTVTDVAKKPVYLAKIHTLIRYGFLSTRKTELELQTDANGQGKFTGLPHEVKKPIVFDVQYKDQTKTVTHDPGSNCHAAIEVELGGK